MNIETPAAEQISKAQVVINDLKEQFVNDKFQFDFAVSQRIAGPANKKLRQEIAKIITGENLPATKAGMYAVSDMLRLNFSQYSLF